jgi:hypothetical protein
MVTAPEPMGLVETPRTDAAEKLAINDVCDDHIVAYHLMREFAADLERETIAKAAEIERLKAALRLIRGDFCENYTTGLGSCRLNGRKPDAEYGADRWCDPCIAYAALQSHSACASSVSREAVQSTAAAAHADIKPVGEELKRIAWEAFEAWDADKDLRVGKMLKALAGRSPRYRADIDALHAALATTPGQDTTLQTARETNKHG